MNEPLPVIPLEYAPPARAASSRAWRHVVRVCLALSLLCCAAAWALVAGGVGRSVLATGPVLFTLGVLLVVGGAITRDPRAAAFGVAHVSVCLLFVLLVNLLHWGPRDAERPFTMMGGAYTLGAWVAAAIFSVLRRPA